MAIPVTVGEELVLSRKSNEQLPRSIIAKDSLWIISRTPNQLSLIEYDTVNIFRLQLYADIFHLSPAYDNLGNLLSDRFWLFWQLNKDLYFSEIEPFLSSPPVFNFTRLIHSNSLGFSCYINEHDSIRINVIEDTVPRLLAVLKYANVDDLSPEITYIDWSDDRDLLSLTNFIDQNTTQFDIGFSKPGSPFNLFIESYTVPVPTGLTGYQVLGTFGVQLSWNASAGSDNYVLQRATDSGFTTDLVTVYDGPLLTVLDSTPGPNTYYYRVLAQVTSLALNSYWSSTFSLSVIITAIDFVGVPTSGYIPLDVQFTYLGSVVGGMIFYWDFGDGSFIVHTQDPPHTYSVPGFFTVSLTITVPGGSASEIKPDYITTAAPAPVADFTASPIDDEYPLVVQFTDASTTISPSTIVSWLWDFGDGHTSTVQSPLHTYNTVGFYTVSLTVTNSYSLTDTETRVDYIKVRGINFTTDFVGVPRDGESPMVVDFTNLTQIPTGHSVLAWEWSFGDGGTSLEENPTHTYISNGYFTVILRAKIAL